MTSQNSPSAPLVVKWTTVFHFTLWRFEADGVREVTRRFHAHDSVGNASLSFDSESACFEAHCLSTYTDDVSLVLEAAVTGFIYEQQSKARVTQQKSKFVHEVLTTSQADPLISLFQESIVDWDAHCDARSQAEHEKRGADLLVDFGQHSQQVEWTPKPSSDLAVVASSDVLGCVGSITGCTISRDPGHKHVIIKPGVTGEPDLALRKLTALEKHLAFQTHPAHSLTIDPELDFEVFLNKLFDRSNRAHTFDGTLSRFLLPVDSPVLTKAPDDQWQKIVAGLFITRTYKRDLTGSYTEPIKRSFRKLAAHKQPKALANFQDIKLQPLGRSQPIAVDIPSEPRRAAPDPSMQSVQNWVQNVPGKTQIRQPPQEPGAGASKPPLGPTPVSMTPKLESVASSRWQAETYEQTDFDADDPWSKHVEPQSQPQPQISASFAYDPWSGPPPKPSDFPTLSSSSPQARAPPNVIINQNVRNAPNQRTQENGRAHGPTGPRGAWAANIAANPARSAWGNGSTKDHVGGSQSSRAVQSAHPAQPDQDGQSRRENTNPWTSPRGRGRGKPNGSGVRGSPNGRGGRSAVVQDNSSTPARSGMERNSGPNDAPPKLIRTMRQRMPAPKLSRVALPIEDVEKRKRVETESIRAAVKSLQDALDVGARAYVGRIDMQVQIGHVFMQNISKDHRSALGHRNFSNTMDQIRGFDTLWENFASPVTSQVSDLDHVLDYAGIPEGNRPYWTSANLELDCRSMDNHYTKLVVNVGGSEHVSGRAPEAYTQKGELLFGAWYTHHPLRVWDQRLVVTGEHRAEPGSHQALLDSLRVRFSSDRNMSDSCQGLQISVQGRDNEGIAVTGVKLVQDVRYRVSPSLWVSEAEAPYYLQLRRVFELIMLRRDSSEEHERGVFIAQNRSEEDMIKRQKFWCEVSIGLVDRPQALMQNEPTSMEYGNEATWTAAEVASAQMLEEMNAIGAKLVQQMDQVGSKNRGLAAPYEERKRGQHDKLMSQADKFW